MSRVLVTGGAGFIGSHVTAKLLAQGHEAIVLDPLRTHATAGHEASLEYRRETLLQGAELVHGSTEDKAELEKIMRDAAPTSIVHLGVLPLATVALEDRQHAFESILHGTVNLLDVAADMGTIEKFVYVSSSMVYGDFTQDPMPETGATSPKEIYGGMKLSGEIMTRAFSQSLGIPHAIVRPSAVYGPGDVNQRIVQKFVESACWNRPLTLVNPATTYLDFSYVGDVAQGIVLAATQPVENETFNITTGEARTLQDLYDVLRARFPDMPVEVVERPSDFRPKRGTLDISKARELLGYEPAFTLETGVATYVDFVTSLPEPAVA
jgi:nucleoside-diphosphate-sugar epimerase